MPLKYNKVIQPTKLVKILAKITYFSQKHKQ